MQTHTMLVWEAILFASVAAFFVIAGMRLPAHNDRSPITLASSDFALRLDRAGAFLIAGLVLLAAIYDVSRLVR